MLTYGEGVYQIDGEVVSFDFATEEHEYTVNGKPVPSVTQIIRGAGLLSSFYKPSGASRGTAVHHALEVADMFGETWESWLEDLDDELKPYADAYRKFRKESLFDIISIEERILAESDGMIYAGTFDRLARFGEAVCLIDIKTGKPEAWHGAQLWAYAQSPAIPEGVRLVDLYLNKKGVYNWHMLTPEEEATARETWGTAIARKHF